MGNAILENNEEGYEKKLFSAREEEGTNPLIAGLSTPRNQASFVLERIRGLLTQELPLGEIAILYRSHHQSLELETLFLKEGIEYVMASGMRFFERAHIKDVISFLRFVSNPRDEVAFLRLVTLLPGVGEKSAKRIWIQQQSASGSDELIQINFSSLKNFSVPKKAQEGWQNWSSLLESLMKLEKEEKPLPEMFRKILEGGYEEYLQQSFENYPQRKKDIEELMILVERYDSLIEFLGEISLFSAGDETYSRYDENIDAITFSSVHQAQGLEWKAVFVIGMAERIFPSSKVLELENLQALEEERRLFYVAVTRAKDYLYLTYPIFHQRGYDGFLEPSSFLREIPEDLIDWSDMLSNQDPS